LIILIISLGNLSLTWSLLLLDKKLLSLFSTITDPVADILPETVLP